MNLTDNRPATRWATRIAFLAAGFANGCWSPLIPYARARLNVDESQVGLLLSCVGIGSIIAMPFTGLLLSRLGTRPLIIATVAGVSLIMPILATASSLSLMGPALALFGAMLGMLDVATNVHALKVEIASDRPLMSGFHAMYSVGGFAGAGALTLLLSLGTTPRIAAFCGAVVMITAVLVSRAGLLRAKPVEKSPAFAAPRGIVLILAILAAATFLTEGAVLDWSALLITGAGLVSLSQGGIGYTLFSIAMAVGRLNGDRVVGFAGRRNVLVIGGLIAIGGFVLLLTAPVAAVALAGFLLIGLGASNIVPVLFSQAGRQMVMPAQLAVAALMTTGYAGILAGPALIGFVSHSAGLPAAFWILAGLMGLVPLLAEIATAAGEPDPKIKR